MTLCWTAWKRGFQLQGDCLRGVEVLDASKHVSKWSILKKQPGCQVCTDEGLLLLEVRLERLFGVHSFLPSCLTTKDALFAHQGLEVSNYIVSTLNPMSGRPALVCWLYIFVSFAERRHPSLRAVSCSPLVSTHLDKSSRPEMGSTWRPSEG